MQIKFFCTSIIAMLAMVNVFSQDAVSIVINGKKIGEKTVAEQPAVISIKKIKYKNISAATLIIKQGIRNDVFKRSIDITDENESSLYTVNESSKQSWYKIDLATVRAKLLKQKKIKVFLIESPANDRMAVRTNRKLLAEIHFK